MSYSLYLLFTVSDFLHLTSRIPALGLIRFDLILIAVITVLIFLGRGRTGGEKGSVKTTNRLVWLIAFILFSLPLVEWPGSVLRYGLEGYSKVAVFFFFTVTLITTESRLKGFILVFILCQTFRVVEPAYLHITTGYWGDAADETVGETFMVLDRLSGAPHDVINPNQLAWVIVSTVPFIYYLGWRRRTVGKLATLIVAPLFLYALLLTGSRSGLISLFVLVMTMIFLSPKKLKSFSWVIILMIPLALFVVGKMSPEFKDRYLSLVDQNRPGGTTVVGRIKGVEGSMTLIWNRPIFGHGLGTSKETSANFSTGRAQPAHDLYIEILQELGIVGFVLFMLYIKEIIVGLRQTKQLLQSSGKDTTWLMNLTTATQAWVLMDLVYSLSCFGLTSWEWYLFGGVSTVCLKLAREQAPESAGLQKAQLTRRSPLRAVLDQARSVTEPQIGS